MRREALAAITAVALVANAAAPAFACTRVLWSDNKLATIAGRSMDWPESTQPVLTVFPRGMKRDGGKLGGVDVVKENPLRWTSQYGSLVTTLYGIGTADGLNEKGLGAHLLFLKAADFGGRDPAKPGLQAGLWVQYVLDNAATVAEALTLLEKIQPVLVETHGHKSSVHLAIEDASGDSAIMEYVGGKPVIHHGRDYKIMTNDPPYDQQLALLKTHDLSKPSKDTPLPGNVNPIDRFVRATYFLRLLPEPKNQREAAAGMFSVVRNVSVPFGAPYGEFGVYNTEYRTVSDLTNKVYFFELTTGPNVVWADLTKFDLKPGAPVLSLDPDNIGLSGDVTEKFRNTKALF
jgi:penicillin V acylase-like amidase (Ntn superfamily)